MIALGSFGQSGQQGRVNPHRDHLPWSVSGRLSPDSPAAKELWKFCNSTDAVFTAAVIGERAPTDWWERGAPKLR